MTARSPRFVRALREVLAGTVVEDDRLGRYSTYRIGGPATVVHPASPADVAAAVRLAHAEGIPVFPLGLGSNVLLPDQGMDALVIRLGKGLDGYAECPDAAGRFRLGAGLPAPLAAKRTASEGWSGLEMMIGVPGTVGGGVYMNAGCHGGEWRDVVESVTVITPAGEDQVLSREAIPFQYRTSGLGDRVVVETVVALRPAPVEEVTGRMSELLAWRQRGTPFSQPCCGSVFRNPDWGGAPPREGPVTAGQLLERAGLKGCRIGRVEVSTLHANYFVNTGGATAADVRALIALAQHVVADRFAVRLEPEVKIVTTTGERGQP